MGYTRTEKQRDRKEKRRKEKIRRKNIHRRIARGKIRQRSSVRFRRQKRFHNLLRKRQRQTNRRQVRQTKVIA